MAPRIKRDLENPTLRFEKQGVDITAELQERFDIDSQRRGRQLDAINSAMPAINSIIQATNHPINGQILSQAFRTFDGKQRQIFFNLIVALEWQPSIEYIDVLKKAFAQVSGLLSDVTDGYMAIGQVTIGGFELMDCADIQIFASNRLSPRSSVDGMNNDEKYQPIRLGRGLWHKVNQANPTERATYKWSHQKGYATIVHELGHYALGLKDQYLDFNTTSQTVLPSRELTKDTIMARLDSSDLLDDGRISSQADVSKLVKAGQLILLSPRNRPKDTDKASEWEALRQHPRYKWLQIDKPHVSQPAPPPEKVIPEFHVIGTADDPFPSKELLFSINGASADGKEIDSDCWVYVVKGIITSPEGLVAQGSFETSGDFPLYGAEIGDNVVLIGKQKRGPGQPFVLWAQIFGQTNGKAAMGSWQDGTPDLIPIVEVAATGVTGNGAAPPYYLKLTGFNPERWKALTFPLGEKRQHVGTEVDGLTVLDGHVMLISIDTDRPQLAIASYSLGGSAFSGYPAHPNPIPSGSSDGNAMLFFYQDEKLVFPIKPPPPDQRFDGSKVVVTTNLQDSIPPPEGCLPRSYVFSVTSNRTFYELRALHPTLILYYDAQSRADIDGDMLIARYVQEPTPSWKLFETTVDKPQDFLAALALEDDQTEPGLFKASPQPDRYRLFLRPRLDTAER